MRRAALWKILLIIHFPILNDSTVDAVTHIIVVRSILVAFKYVLCIDVLLYVYLMG